MFSKLVLASRIILGLMFTIFGLNGLMMAITGAGFMPSPPMPEQMIPIMTGFMAMKYLFPLVSLLEFISGLLLLSNRYLNMSIIFLGPIIVNMLGIHFAVDVAGGVMAYITAILFVIIVKSRWSDFKVMLKK